MWGPRSLDHDQSFVSLDSDHSCVNFVQNKSSLPHRIIGGLQPQEASSEEQARLAKSNPQEASSEEQSERKKIFRAAQKNLPNSFRAA